MKVQLTCITNAGSVGGQSPVVYSTKTLFKRGRG